MHVIIIRHAQSQANADVPGAPIDCELTDLGRRQAEATGVRLAKLGVDTIFCSPYIRALETATAIHRATGAPIEVFTPIHEHHIDWHHPPETDASALARMGRALELIRARFANDPERHTRRVCLVSHGSPTGKLIMAFQGITTIHADIRIENASTTSLSAVGRRHASHQLCASVSPISPAPITTASDPMVAGITSNPNATV